MSAGVTPEMAALNREDARYYVGRGIPASIGDWFRALHEEGLIDEAP